MKKIIACISIVVLLTNCAKENPKVIRNKKVHSYKVSSSTVPHVIDALGHITALNSAEIRAQVEGRLLDSHFEEGSTVQKDDPLFTIDPRPYIASRDKALANILDNEAKLSYAAESVQRNKNLTCDNYIAALDFKQLETQMQSYLAIIEQNKADLELALINLDYCFIKAPFKGVTSKKLLDKGNLITNNGEPLLTLNQIDPIYIDFSISEKHFSIVSSKQKEKPLSVEVYLKGNTATPLIAQLEMINNQVNQKTGMIFLRAIRTNEDQVLWPGQFVKTKLILEEIQDALIIPNECIALGQKGHYVFIIREDNTVSYQEVTLGMTIDGVKTQIVKGIKEGDSLVSEGLIRVKNGDKVEIIRKSS